MQLLYSLSFVGLSFMLLRPSTMDNWVKLVAIYYNTLKSALLFTNLFYI